MYSKSFIILALLCFVLILSSTSCSKTDNPEETKNITKIKEYLSIVLPLFRQDRAFENINMTPIPSIDEGTILITGKVPTKNALSILYICVHTETNSYFAAPVDIKWKVSDYNNELYPIENISYDWLD